MLTTAEARGDQDLLIVAHSNTCAAHFWRGEMVQSRLHGDSVTARYDEQRHRHFADFTNTDPKTNDGLSDALGTWMRGYPEQAVRKLQANERHARQRTHSFALGFACVLGSLLYEYRREPAAMLARVSEAEQVGRAQSARDLGSACAGDKRHRMDTSRTLGGGYSTFTGGSGDLSGIQRRTEHDLQSRSAGGRLGGQR